MSTDENRGAIITEALAEYFECDPETIQGYIVGVERVTDPEEGGLFFSSVWSMNKPMWQLLGFCDELKHHLGRQRTDTQVPMNGEVQESRQVRRARTRGSRKRT